MRLFSVKDQTIMAWFEMKREASYVRYTEICNQRNYCKALDFSSVETSRAHFLSTKKLDERLQDECYGDVAEWLDVVNTPVG